MKTNLTYKNLMIAISLALLPSVSSFAYVPVVSYTARIRHFYHPATVINYYHYPPVFTDTYWYGYDYDYDVYDPFYTAEGYYSDYSGFTFGISWGLPAYFSVWYSWRPYYYYAPVVYNVNYYYGGPYPYYPTYYRVCYRTFGYHFRPYPVHYRNNYYTYNTYNYYYGNTGNHGNSGNYGANGSYGNHGNQGNQGDNGNHGRYRNNGSHVNRADHGNHGRYRNNGTHGNSGNHGTRVNSGYLAGNNGRVSRRSIPRSPSTTAVHTADAPRTKTAPAHTSTYRRSNVRNTYGRTSTAHRTSYRTGSGRGGNNPATARKPAPAMHTTAARYRSRTSTTTSARIPATVTKKTGYHPPAMRRSTGSRSGRVAPVTRPDYTKKPTAEKRSSGTRRRR